MREALALLPALVAIVAAARAARRGRAAAGVLGAGACIAALAVAGLAPLPPWVRAALCLHAIATLGKTLALGPRSTGARGPAWTGAYLVAWPGLREERAFVRDPSASRRAGAIAAVVGLAEVALAFGLAALARSTGLLDRPEPLPSWARAASFVALFDGAFRAAFGAARAAGFLDAPGFRAPWALTDLSDFWGRRWNAFVSESLAREVYAPVRARTGRAVAVLAAFFVSGVLHEVAFGVAAGRVTGLFFAFFALHGVAVLALHPLRRRHPPLARGFAWVVLLAGAPLFFGGTYPEVVPLGLPLGALFAGRVGG